MTRQSSHRRGAALLVAAIAATVAASVVPASAAVSTPVKVSDSLRNGFNKDPFTIAVLYNVNIDPNASSVTVLKNDGVTPVTGSDFTLLGNQKMLVFQTSAQGPFNEIDSPYTATFTARGVNQTVGSPSAQHTIEFDVDFITPFPAQVHLNEETGGRPFVSLGTDSLTINGTARDIAGENGVASGVEQVRVHFYNPLMNPTGLLNGGSPEIMAMRRTISFECNPKCNTSESLAIDISDIPTGYWNIKVSVVDAAGNASSQSESMPVLRIAAA